MRFGFAQNAAKPRLGDTVLLSAYLPRFVSLAFGPEQFPLMSVRDTFTRADIIEFLNLNPTGWELADLAGLAPQSDLTGYPVARSAIEAIGCAYITKHEIDARLLKLGVDRPERTTRPWSGRTVAGWSRKQIEAMLGLSRDGVLEHHGTFSPLRYPVQLALGIAS